MGINLFSDLGYDENSSEVRRAREEAALYEKAIRALSEARKREGLTQKQLAARMKTTQSAVSDIESASTDVRLSTAIRYALALDHDPTLQMRRRTPLQDSVWREVSTVAPVSIRPPETVKVRLRHELLASFEESPTRFTAANSRRYEFERAA